MSLHRLGESSLSYPLSLCIQRSSERGNQKDHYEAQVVTGRLKIQSVLVVVTVSRVD